MASKNKGFYYSLTIERIRAYIDKPVSKRLEWLYQANIFRKKYPKKIIRIQDEFRQGTI